MSAEDGEDRPAEQSEEFDGSTVKRSLKFANANRQRMRAATVARGDPSMLPRRAQTRDDSSIKQPARLSHQVAPRRAVTGKEAFKRQFKEGEEEEEEVADLLPRQKEVIHPPLHEIV